MPQHPATLSQLFIEAVEEHDRPNALQAKVGGAYQPVSHCTLADRVRHVAFGLRALGVTSSDRVAILSENRPEWAIADYACLALGVADVPIYPTLPRGADRVHPERLGRGRDLRLDGGAGREGPKLRARAARAPARDRVRRDAARAATSRSLRSRRRARVDDDGARGALARARWRHARRRRDDHLHVGHDGRARRARCSRTATSSRTCGGGDRRPFAGDDMCLSFLPLSHIFERMVGTIS